MRALLLIALVACSGSDSDEEQAVCFYEAGPEYNCNCHTESSGGITVTICDSCKDCRTCPREGRVGKDTCITDGKSYLCHNLQYCAPH